MSQEQTHKLNERFFNDPEWVHVEQMIMSHVDSLKDMSTIDLKQPAEHVKAEVIGRTIAYEHLVKFLNETRFVSRPLPENTNPFK